MMDSPQQLLSDNSSYRWLIAALNDSSRSTTALGCSFIELDPASISMRFASDRSGGGDDNAMTDFDFDLPDKVFPTGIALLLPPAAKAASDELSKLRSASSASSSPVLRTSRSSPASWVSACSSLEDQDSRRGETFASGFGSAPKKILRRYLRFLLMPLFRRVKEFKLSSKNSARRWKDSSARSSRRSSNALGSRDWCRSNADISISDAILHCKKSNGFRSHQLEDA